MKAKIRALISKCEATIIILKSNKKKDPSPISVALRDRSIDELEQIIFDLYQLLK